MDLHQFRLLLLCHMRCIFCLIFSAAILLCRANISSTGCMLDIYMVAVQAGSVAQARSAICAISKFDCATFACSLSGAVQGLFRLKVQKVTCPTSRTSCCGARRLEG
jgi:hypothetical protein